MSTTWGPGLQAEHAHRSERLLAATRAAGARPAGRRAAGAATSSSSPDRAGGRRGAAGWAAWTLTLRRWSGATPS